MNGNKFDPYIDNGGTIIGLAGKDYVIIASDTRLSNQYMIQSRNISRIFKVIFIHNHCGYIFYVYVLIHYMALHYYDMLQ